MMSDFKKNSFVSGKAMEYRAKHQAVEYNMGMERHSSQWNRHFLGTSCFELLDVITLLWQRCGS